MLIFQKNFCIIEKDKKVERNAIMNLEEIRTEIDALDKELLALFERRMDLCRDVALYKKEHNLPVFQP